jgi:hypothetical protein
MTVIASFSIQGFPVLVGDLLLSGDEDLNKTIQIPTLGEITKVFPKGSGYVPCGLKQKIAIVNDNIALAWAGTRLSAQIIISDLIKKARKKKYWTLDDLSYFFSNYNKEHGEKVCIVGFSNDGKGIFSFGYGINCINYESGHYGLVRLAGTGAADFKNYLDSFDIPPQLNTANPLEKAVGKTLVISTYMKGLESVSGNNLLQYYGGGFEILSYVRKKFKKIDDITYLVWNGRQVTNSSWELGLPRIAIKYSYSDDILLLRKEEFIPHSKDQVKRANKAIYVVAPIYRDINNNELKNIRLESFNSKFIGSFINLLCLDGSNSILSRVNYSGQHENPIRFRNEENENIFMDIKHEFIESIFKGMHA